MSKENKVISIDSGLIKKISGTDVENLFASALQTVRGRKHCNLHQTQQEPCQRLLNAILPDSYIRPHRHLEGSGVETLVVLKGEAKLLIFDDHGEIIYVDKLSGDDGVMIAEVPPQTWHTVLAEEPSGVLIFEVKQGPFCALNAKDFAPWAPDEKSKSVHLYLANLKRRAMG